jgi:hypothetical protein
MALGDKVAAFRRESWQGRIRNRLPIALGALAGCLGATLPAKAYEVYFNAPNVLGGIRGVAITLPSTGETSLYDVTLRKGTLAAIYGSPLLLDVNDASDAQALMERSANAINAYITAIADDSLSFAEAGEDAYSIPYGSPYVNTSGATVINISYSGKECPAGYYWDGSKCVYLSTPTTNLPIPHRLISPRLTTIPIDQITVWADLNYSSPPVPGPLPLAGGAAAWGWARRIRRRCGSVGPDPARRPPEPISLGNGAQP